MSSSTSENINITTSLEFHQKWNTRLLLSVQSDPENLDPGNLSSPTTPDLVLQAYRPPPDLAPYYVVIVPLLLTFSFGAFLGNVYLLACVPWIRRAAMTANLRLSLSLAGADAYAAFLIFCGLLINSYIPVVHDVRLGAWTACYFLILELLRLAGVITSAFHLLILACNHWLSIVTPLRYKTMMTTYACRLIAGFLWTAPVVIMFGYAFTIPYEGFRSRYCAYAFYYRFGFRLMVMVLFATPMLLMSIIYADILRRLAAANRRRSQIPLSPSMERSSLKKSKSLSTERRKSDEQSLKNSKTRRRSIDIDAGPLLLIQNGHHNNRRGSTPFDDTNKRTNATFLRVNSGNKHAGGAGGTTGTGSACYSSQGSKRKAITTTLLILITFAVGWMPAVAVFVVVCTNCSVKSYPPRTDVFVVNIVVNTLMMMKLLINPFIYGFRILDINYALWAMRVSRFGRKQLPHRNVPKRFGRLHVPHVHSVNANIANNNANANRLHQKDENLNFNNRRAGDFLRASVRVAACVRR